MFRWYRDAAKCYVYLTDVSTPIFHVPDMSIQPWEAVFRESRWFTRGWTLQELIAPSSVDFFSKEGVELGNRSSLERHIHEVTGIPLKALRDHTLSDFSVHERMLWAEKRETTRKEDKAYSLLGIFDVHMPLIYGEGRDKAFKRLREEIDKDSKDSKFLTKAGNKREDFTIPFSLSEIPETEHFIAREAEHAAMHAVLRCNNSRSTVILHGLGGIGKTQLSVAYAKRHGDVYSAIFWLSIKDEESLTQSFAKLAKRILREHPSASPLSSVDMDGDLDKVVDAVKAWLSIRDNTRWLMIYDNYDNPKLPDNSDSAAVDIRKYLPESYQGSVVITTRSSQVKIGHSILIRKLENVGDSLNILLNTSGRGETMNDPDAVRLAEELDGLPLALATAGAYLSQVATTFSDYLRLYRASWARLQQSSPGLSSYDRTLYSTWQLSFDRIKQQNELSAMLLRFWAYFDNQDIWFELLQYAKSEDPKWIRDLTEDEMSFNGAVRVLSEHGLVEVDSSVLERVESKGYSIHGCVHSWTIHVLNREWDYDLAQLALKFVGSHVPRREEKWWLTGRRLLAHVVRCTQLVVSGMIAVDGVEWALHELGGLYRKLGNLDEAEIMYQRALQGKEKALGPEHPSTLYTVNSLGLLYQNRGKLDEAEMMYQRALQGKEKALGPDHTSTLDTVHNLGLLYQNQGKLDEAEIMYQRALQGTEKALGLDHPSTLDTVHNLGDLYRKQGKLDEAEIMYQQALQGTEKALGPDHTSTLDTVHGLGLLYQKQGKLDEAEMMLQRALQGYEKAVGSVTIRRYQPTLNTMWSLGNLFTAQGYADKAKEMYSRAYAGFLTTSGPSSKACQSLNRKIARLDHMQVN